MDIVLSVLGGLGLFLFGMNMLSDSLQKTAGNRLQNIIKTLTKNIFMSIIVGAFVTMLLQSSSGTSVMVIGFVNAGMMNLTQAAGVLMGANIGTTITSQLIAFNVSEYAPILVIIGVAVSMISSNEQIRNFSDVLTGIGILFIGMDMMGAGLVLLSRFPEFGEFMATLNNPVLGVIAGFSLTTIVQSSSASVGLLQALGMGGLINMTRAFPILLGNNIGTTTTSLISSIGANKNAKRTAYLNVLINLIGAVLFIAILQKPIQSIVVAVSPDNISRQIANSHTIFNVVSVLIQLPFIKYIVRLVNWLVPDKGEEDDIVTTTLYLDDRLAEKTPGVAIGQVNKEVVRMAEVTSKNLKDSQEVIISGNLSLVRKLEKREKLINILDKEITDYLLMLSNRMLSDNQHSEVNKLMYIVNDLERIGDHVDNIKEIGEYHFKHKTKFTEESIVGLNEMFKESIDMVEKTAQALKHSDKNTAFEILRMEDKINKLEAKNRKEHLDRLNNKKVDAESGINFLEIVSNLERLSDHTYNVATQLLNTFPKDK
ncbi:MAG: Na/Pi cotransporter family protein [Atopostipes suicloacalis]|nr:Na/Pi cotransporter family protein [Atopostipes suicloacalis]